MRLTTNLLSVAGLLVLSNSCHDDRPTGPMVPGSRMPILFTSDRDGDLNVFTMSSDGSVQRHVTRHPADDQSADWNPDGYGSRIAFMSNRDGEYEIKAGVVSIRATSFGLFDSTSVQVVDPNAAPVATVTLSPAAQTVAVFDSLAIAATVRDAQENVLRDRLVTWAVSDTAVVRLAHAGSSTAHFVAKQAGSATVTATSEGKRGTATVTVSQ